MHPSRQARCTALLTEPETLHAAAALELVDGHHSILREAMVVYAVSPDLPNAAEVLASGLQGRVQAWKQHAISPT